MESASAYKEEVRSGFELLASDLPELKSVEKLIREKLPSQARTIEDIGFYLLELGGKRIRPLISLLSAKMFGSISPAVIDVAAGIELIHMATLLHDDIIDRSPLRRHKQSPLVRFGAESTLLAGDFLLVRAFSLCAKLDPFIIDATERACMDLTEGEMLETPLFLESHTLQSSLEISRKKTASLFRLATLSGSHLASAGATAEKAMGDFGEKLGIAFQVLDDILDVCSDEGLLGKKSGIDIRERKPSTVNVLWLESNNLNSAKLREKPNGDDEDYVSESLTELRGSPVVEKARAIAQDYSEKARECLRQAADSSKVASPKAFFALNSLIDFALKRLA